MNQSRRTFVEGVAGGVLATAVGSAPAQPGTRPGGPPGPVDPVTEYARPPFPKQQQPWPGLASKMTPRPTTAKPAIAARAA